MRSNALVNATQTGAEHVNELKALYVLTDRLYRARAQEEVFDAALDAIIATLRCDRASILLFDGDGKMRFVAWRGLSDDYRRMLGGHTPWQPGETDPEPIFVEDIDATDEADWVKAAVKKEGIRSLGFIPLVADGGVAGKFMTYYAAPHAFTEHETELAVTIARQVGFSVERALSERARQRAEDELRDSEARFRLMVEHAPVMIWMSDTAGNCVQINRMLREFWGVAPEDLARFDWRQTVHPDDAPTLAQRVTEALSSRSGFALKARFRNAAGTYRVLDSVAQPRLSPSGVLLGMIGVNVDVTERESAERALRESEERFRLAVEAAPSGMVMTDDAGRILMVNANAAALFGYDPAELEGQSVETLVPERSRPIHPKLRTAYGSTRRARAMGYDRELYARRKDGSEIPVEIGLSPFDGPEGPMTIAAVVDISGRKRAEAQRELLVAELNHRVKNTLAVVQAVAHQTFKRSGATEACRAFEGRLSALARAHDRLTRASWESASLDQLAADALQVHGPNPHRVVLEGPSPMLLQPKQALSISMALHELFTNAVKYGALSTESGRVRLSWKVVGQAVPRLRLIWQEEGGPPVVAPARRGFGHFMIERTLAHDLDGSVTLDYAPGGLVCTIEAPLPAQGSGAP